MRRDQCDSSRDEELTRLESKWAQNVSEIGFLTSIPNEGVK